MGAIFAPQCSWLNLAIHTRTKVTHAHLKGWVMTLARWNMLKKLGTYAMRRRRPAIFSVCLCLVSHAPSRCTFWLVLHAWQMCVPMSKFFMLLWPTVVVQLWQLCTTLHWAAPGSKVPR